MKILLIHTHYLQKGGEDTVFEQEYDLLCSQNTVKKIVFYNKSGGSGAIQFLVSIYNLVAMHKVRKAVREFGPDVAHIHNIHFASGPGIIRSLKSLHVPVILTLHNFRLICPSGTLSINGDLFLESIRSEFPWSAVKRRAYRNSSLQTFWLAFVIWFHRKIGTWKYVDQYICLTEHAKRLFVESRLALSPTRIAVKPNFIQAADSAEYCHENHFLFVGRLTYEKGIDVLLDAFAQTDLKIRIVGGGPLENLVVEYAARNANIKYLGNLDRVRVLEEMNSSSALIFPSVWFEGMPMTIIEAFSTGTPIIASKLGAMETMISDGLNGLLFDAKSAADLQSKIFAYDNLPHELKKSMQKSARQAYERIYSPEANYDRLISIYNTSTQPNHKSKF